MKHTKTQQDRQEEAIDQWPLRICLHEPKIVHHAGDCAQVSQTVQQLPPPSTKSCDPFLCRSNRQRNHHYESAETGSNKRTLVNVLNDIRNREKLIEPRIR